MDAGEISTFVGGAAPTGWSGSAWTGMVGPAIAPVRVRVFTPAAWWLALSPVWIWAVQNLLTAATGGSDYSDHPGSNRSSNAVLIGVLLLGVNLATVLLAVRDRRQLLESRNPTAAAWWWWFLTPFVYLLVRAVHVRGSGWVLAVVYPLSFPIALIALVGIADIVT